MRRLSRRQFGAALLGGFGVAALTPIAGAVSQAAQRSALLPALPSASPTIPRMASPAAVRLDPALPLHPLLQVGAQLEPNKLARVIVQKSNAAATGAGLAACVGGCAVEDFRFIKGHLLEVMQGQLRQLALHPDVRYISPDGPVHPQAISTAALKTTYQAAVGIDKVWNGSLPATGKGVTVAVIDTGVSASHPDFAGRLVGVSVHPQATAADDRHGHGTHVAGILAGRDTLGRYIGVAPDARVLGVKIADDRGNVMAADLLRGLQWCYDHRAAYNLRAVNLSITVGTPESYRTSPICAAAEQLWFAGVVVVVAAGNLGTAPNAMHYVPANDPYVITVGCLDHNQSAGPGDDRLAEFSSRGTTQNSYTKPDLLAPGRRIVAPLASPDCVVAREFADRITDGRYVRLSGTSMAAPVVAGVVALVLERYPTMQPDEVKWLLAKVANKYGGLVGVVDPVEAMTTAKSTKVWSKANQGLTPNSGLDLSTKTVRWGEAYWEAGKWTEVYWEAGKWTVFPLD